MNLIDVFVLGLIGGLTPGPITALILGQTLKFGLGRGVSIASALIVTNLIFAPLSFVLLSFFTEINQFLNILSVFGAFFLIYLGILEWNSQLTIDKHSVSRPFIKALTIDFVNPHPYFFWFTILGPAMIAMQQLGSFSGPFLVTTFFTAGLVLVKLIYVLLIHRIKPYLTPQITTIIIRILSLILIGFGIKLLYSIIFS